MTAIDEADRAILSSLLTDIRDLLTRVLQIDPQGSQFPISLRERIQKELWALEWVVGKPLLALRELEGQAEAILAKINDHLRKYEYHVVFDPGQSGDGWVYVRNEAEKP